MTLAFVEQVTVFVDERGKRSRKGDGFLILIQERK